MLKSHARVSARLHVLTKRRVLAQLLDDTNAGNEIVSADHKKEEESGEDAGAQRRLDPAVALLLVRKYEGLEAHEGDGHGQRSRPPGEAAGQERREEAPRRAGHAEGKRVRDLLRAAALVRAAPGREGVFPKAQGHAPLP